MASNLAQHASNGIPQSKVRAGSIENASDTKSVSILSDLQSLWVLFDPTSSARTHSSIARESDILSFTNDTNSQVTETDSDGTNSQYRGSHREVIEEEDDDDDSLIDNLESRDSTPSQSRLEQLFLQANTGTEPANLDNRINQWKQNDLEELIDDNVASWDLDENLISQVLDKLLISKLKGKKIPPQGFYGDDYFSNYRKSDYIKFKKASNNLRHHLSRDVATSSSTLPEIINQLLTKFLLQHEHNSHRPNNVDIMKQQRKRYSTILNQSTSNNQLISSIIDNQLNPSTPVNSPFLSPLQTSQEPGSPVGLHLTHSLEYSDTATSSSLVLCGGARMGGNSWGDI